MVQHEFNGTLVGTAEPIIVTVDGGASRTRVALGGAMIQQNGIKVFDTLHDLDQQIEMVTTKILEVTDGKLPDMVGYGIAGEVSDDGLTIVQGGQLNKYGWLHQPISQNTVDSLGIGLDRFVLVNDLVAAGLSQRESDRREITGSKDITVRLPEDYAGAITAISTGNNTSLYDSRGAVNLESGHWLIGRHADHPCGCGQVNDIEAWVSGSAIAKRFGVTGKDIPAGDARWDAFNTDMATIMADQLVTFEQLVAENNRQLHKLTLFGSVALGNSGAVEALRTRFKHTQVDIGPASYGDDSGLYGGYFAGLEKLALAG